MIHQYLKFQCLGISEKMIEYLLIFNSKRKLKKTKVAKRKRKKRKRRRRRKQMMTMTRRKTCHLQSL
jgi:hypothetical protein